MLHLDISWLEIGDKFGFWEGSKVNLIGLCVEPSAGDWHRHLFESSDAKLLREHRVHAICFGDRTSPTTTDGFV